MSTMRQVAPVTSSSLFFKYLATAASRSCPHARRLAASGGSRSNSSKRALYTQPAYTPHSLPESFPPPPRNSGIPETSIAGPKPTLGSFTSRSTQNVERHRVSKDAEGQEVTTVSLREGEAQKSKPVTEFAESRDAAAASALTTAPTTQATKDSAAKEKPAPRKSKLRPLKAALSISPPAVDHLRALLSSPDPQLIRIGVRNRGCSGLAYHLEYVDKPGRFDEVVEQDGVKVLIDSKALFSIIGSEMDWQEDKLQSRFVFRNPNIKEQCGCGESFMV